MSHHVCMYHLYFESPAGLGCRTVLGSMDEVDVEKENLVEEYPGVTSFSVVKHSDDDCDMSECDADPVESAE
jgi:uncharacterized protein (UPF0179 family)